MQLTAEQTAAIATLVEGHCETNGLVPPGFTLKVTVSLEPAPLVTVESILADSILDQPAAESFLTYWDKQDPTGRQGTIVNVFGKLNPGNKETPTIRDVLTYRGSPLLSEPLDKQWLRLRDFGSKGLKMVDEWLTSMNLRRGMELPKATK